MEGGAGLYDDFDPFRDAGAGLGPRWSNSVFRVAQNDSVIALSKQTPVRPIDWSTPSSSQARCTLVGGVLGAAVGVEHDPAGHLAAQDLRGPPNPPDQVGVLVGVHRPTSRPAESSRPGPHRYSQPLTGAQVMSEIHTLFSSPVSQPRFTRSGIRWGGTPRWWSPGCERAGDALTPGDGRSPPPLGGATRQQPEARRNLVGVGEDLPDLPVHQIAAGRLRTGFAFAVGRPPVVARSRNPQQPGHPVDLVPPPPSVRTVRPWWLRRRRLLFPRTRCPCATPPPTAKPVSARPAHQHSPPIGSPACLANSSRTHLPSNWSPNPSSRATCATGRPDSITRPAASTRWGRVHPRGTNPKRSSLERGVGSGSPRSAHTPAVERGPRRTRGSAWFTACQFGQQACVTPARTRIRRPWPSSSASSNLSPDIRTSA